MFWKDMWNERVLCHQFSQLFSFSRKEDVTVKTMLLMNNMQEHFHLHLSEEAYDKFCDLTVFLQLIQLNGNIDGWSYIWGNDKFSS
jgi:hypothetical protein